MNFCLKSIVAYVQLTNTNKLIFLKKKQYAFEI